MKTVKQVSEITGVSIRTLRYYDKVGLLKPSEFTEAGYRLYDEKALEKLQQILFFKELELPLAEIKEMMNHPDYDKEEVLSIQRSMLVNKRNHLNGLIELIDDVRKGVNTMSFEVFNEEDIEKIVTHTIEHMKEDVLAEEIEKHGGLLQYRTFLATNLSNEQAMSDLIKWYGSKEKAIEAVLQSTGDEEDIKKEQDEVSKVYHQFVKAKEDADANLEHETVKNLTECYKKIFQLDNARAILLDLAAEYLRQEKLAEVTDIQYGEGMSEFIGKAIQKYYGE